MLLVALTVVGLAACSTTAPATQPSPPSTSEPSGEVVVFAASSLTDAFNDAKVAFQAKYPKVTMTYNFGGTPALRTQLEQGARADVFASANQEQMDLAIKNHAVQGPSQAFTSNRLVVITPADNKKVQTLADVAKPGLKLVLALKEVPVGGYARDALSKMNASEQFGADFSSKVLSNLVSEEQSVRQAVAKVVLGEADVAIVYGTDVTPDVAPKVKTIAIPDRYNVLAVYPIATVKGAPNVAAGQRFIEFLLSAEGQAILAKRGFGGVPH